MNFDHRSTAGLNTNSSWISDAVGDWIVSRVVPALGHILLVSAFYKNDGPGQAANVARGPAFKPGPTPLIAVLLDGLGPMHGSNIVT